jgi:hypothetical protein
LLFPLRRFDALEIADPRDIACMKVEAIAHRGSRRDFIDLFVAGRELGLPNILQWFSRKYASVAYNRVHVLKALAYFADAEEEPLPHLLVPLEWSAVKGYFTSEVPRLARVF